MTRFKKLKKKYGTAFYISFLVLVVVLTVIVSMKLTAQSIIEQYGPAPTTAMETQVTATVSDAEVEETGETVEEPLFDVVEDFEDADDNDEDEEESTPEGNFIKLNSPDHNTKFTDVEEVVFKGEVSPNTEKVVVNALVVSDKGKTFNAIFTIRDFEIGDKRFEYKSRIDWKNLTVGTNHYHFKAHYDDGTTESQSVTVYLEETPTEETN